jgi:hypothetical protein
MRKVSEGKVHNKVLGPDHVKRQYMDKELKQLCYGIFIENDTVGKPELVVGQSFAPIDVDIKGGVPVYVVTNADLSEGYYDQGGNEMKEPCLRCKSLGKVVCNANGCDSSCAQT